MDFECRTIAFGSDLHRAQQELREAVLRRPLDRALSPAERAADAQAHLFAALADGRVVASAILFPQGAGTVRLRQMAVAPGLQGRGVGAGLLRFVEDWARDGGAVRIVLHARATAASFYEGLGYESEGAPFDEDGVPHILMARTL